MRGTASSERSNINQSGSDEIARMGWLAMGSDCGNWTATQRQTARLEGLGDIRFGSCFGHVPQQSSSPAAAIGHQTVAELSDCMLM